jgi:cytochrome c oxidase subunit IV
MLAAKSIQIKPCTVAWLLLVTLSTVSYVLGYDKSGAVFITFILFITLIKSQLIIRYFMGIRRVRPLWQFLTGIYLVVIGSIIGLAYFSY